MSGSGRPTVGIRLSAEGAEKVKRDLEALGPAGQKAFDTIQRASLVAQPEMQKLGTSIDVVQRAFIGMGGSMGRVGSVATGVAGVAGTLTTALLAVGAAGATAAIGIAKAGDEATATMARLTSATGGMAQAQAVYENLFRLSQQTGVAVAESAGSFARFSVAAKEIGATNDQVLKLVAGIQKAGIVSGATGQETSAAVQQIGQALASGKLQGDELRSLLENMPQFAQALARELGVGVGRLREMGSEGKLTADIVFPAMLKAAEKMGAEFDKMPVTMSRAKDILLAATEDFGARLDRITGLSRTFAAFMQQGAAALRSAGQIIAPTDREAADQGVAAAERRAAQVRAQVAAERAASAYGDISPGLKMAEEIARQELAEALAKQNEIRRGDRELQRAEAADAAQQAAESRRARFGVEVREIAEFADKRLKIARETAEKLKKIDDAEAAGVTTMGGSPGVPGARFDAAAARAGVLREQREELEKLTKEEAKGGEEARKAAEKRKEVIATLDAQVTAAEAAYKATVAGTVGSRELAIALEIENKIHAAGIPAIEKRTEAEKAAAKTIEARVRSLDAAKEAEKKFQEEAKKAKEYADKSFNELTSIGERAFDRLGDAIVNAFVSGQGAAVNFGNIARGVLGSVVSDIAKLAIVNPILNSIFTSSSGPRPTLSGAFGGSATSLGGGGFSIPGLGSLSSLLPSGGIAGLMSTQIINPGFGGTAVGPLAEIVGGGSGATLGGLLGGAGAGFGAGMFLNNLLGGNQTGGMVGSGLGALGGAVLGSIIPGIGTLIGGLIGGAAGGGLGGLIGPGPSVNSYGLRLQSTGFVENGANDFAGSLAPVSRQFYDKEGDAKFQEAEALVKAVNAYMAANGIQVAGASIIGGNKNGADGSGFFNIGDAFANLNFRSADNEKLSAYLGTQAFDDPAKLQAAVEGFKQAAAAIEALGAEAVPAFTASLKAVNDNFDAGVEAARKYGLAEDNLTTARAKAIDALEAQRTETLRQSDVSLAIRRAAAGGDTQQAELARQAEAARQELDAFGKSLDALAINAEDKAARIVALEEVQAAERLAIISRYGEQAATALRQAGGNIRAYLDSLATGTAAGASPTDRLAAAQANFERDRVLATGGDRDALGRITGSADALLSAGRDMYASGAGFQAIKGTVTGGLSGLPVVQSYDAMQAASLAAIQTALTTGTLNTQTVILSNGNTVQIAGGIGDMSAVTAALAIANQSLANAIGTLNTGFGGTWQGLADTIGTLNTGFAGTWKGLSDTIATLNSGLGVVATNIATHAANDNAGFGSLGTTLNLANTIAAQIRTDTLSARGYLSFIDNTTKALSNYAITNFQAQNAGNTIAKDASASSVAGFAGLTTVAVDAAAANSAGLAALTTVSVDGSGAAVAALNASNTIAASNANAFVAAMNANNVITADGNTRVAAIQSYSSFIDNTLRAQNNYILDLRTELQGLRQQINQLNASIQQGATLNATETRAVAARVGDVDDTLRRNAA